MCWVEGRSEFVPSKGAKGQCRRIFKFHGDVLTNQFVLLSILPAVAYVHFVRSPGYKFQFEKKLQPLNQLKLI